MEGRVGGYSYGAVAAGEEEVGWRGGVGEGALVCLEGGGVRGLGGRGGVDGDGDEGVVLVGGGGCVLAWETGRESGGEGGMYLSPHHDNTPVRRPRNGQSFSSELYSRRASLAPHVPKPARTITADRSQLGLFGRIPSNPLYSTRMPSQLGAVLHLRLFRIPYTQRAICRASSY